jgi:uncharacterized protein
LSQKKLIGIIAACFVVIIVVVIMATRGERPPAPTPEPVSEEISWAINETTVYATITRPAGEGLYPAVVFVPGSGPTDRDWNTPFLPGDNGSAILLARELAGQGFVTIRYDKRFTGPGASQNMPHMMGRISLASHIEEIAGAVDHLLAQAYVDPDRLYVLSNSEGAFHALNYYLQYGERVAGLVLTAPPGRPMADLMIEQVRAQAQALPDGDEIIAGFEALMADFLEGKPFVPNPALPDALNDYASSWYQPINLPYTREIFPLDPAELLAQVTVPTLVVIGRKDIQVDWEGDGGLLQAATANLTNVVYEFPENANHVLKYESKLREQLTPAEGMEYNLAGKVLDQDALQAIVGWLKEQN